MSSIPSTSAKASKNEDWETLHTVCLSQDKKMSGHKKCIVLKKFLKSEGDNPLILADIRAFLNGRATKVGVCLTQHEFNFLAQCLLYPKDVEQKLNNKSATRSLTIRSKPKKVGGVEVTQRVEDKIRRINLYKKEVSEIVNNFGDFYNLIEDMEENEEDSDLEDEANS